MSGIAKPSISSSTSTTPGETVLVEDIIGMAPVDIPTSARVGIPSPPEFSIVFSLKSNGAPQTKRWVYTTAALRNSALTAAQTLTSANV